MHGQRDIDDRSAMSKAMAMATSVTSVALEMVLPVFLGYWLDTKLGTRALFAIVGGAVGLTAGIWNLVRLTRRRGS